jgi:hypothetical protein
MHDRDSRPTLPLQGWDSVPGVMQQAQDNLHGTLSLLGQDLHNLTSRFHQHLQQGEVPLQRHASLAAPSTAASSRSLSSTDATYLDLLWGQLCLAMLSRQAGRAAVKLPATVPSDAHPAEGLLDLPVAPAAPAAPAAPQGRPKAASANKHVWSSVLCRLCTGQRGQCVQPVQGADPNRGRQPAAAPQATAGCPRRAQAAALAAASIGARESACIQVPAVSCAP